MLFAVLLLISSCGGAGDIFNNKIVNSKTFPAGTDRVWDEVVSIFGDLNFPIKVLEKNSFLIQSDEVIISKSEIYTYTQTEGGDYSGGGKMSFTVYLKNKGNEGTEVKISTNFMGYWTKTGYNTKESGVQNLYSNGFMENIIFERINNRLGKSNVTDNKKDINSVKSTGSGFLISNNGYIVTNYHVIDGANKISITFPSKNIDKIAKVKIKDPINDLAILEIQDFTLSDISYQDIPFTFASVKDVKIGQDVFTLGFPLGELMGKDARLSTGVIQSLYGIQDEPTVYQINNPIQPGNSGGALFNRKGELVGICVSSLDAIAVFKYTGTLPQNINFAVKISFLTNLISNLKEGDEILSRTNTVTQGELDKQVEQLTPYIVQVKIY